MVTLLAGNMSNICVIYSNNRSTSLFVNALSDNSKFRPQFSNYLNVTPTFQTQLRFETGG